MNLVDTSVLVDWLRKGVMAKGYISVITLIEFFEEWRRVNALRLKTH